MFWNHVTPSEDEVWRSRLENPCPFSDKQCKKSTILRICEMGNPGKEKKKKNGRDLLRRYPICDRKLSGQGVFFLLLQEFEIEYEKKRQYPLGLSLIWPLWRRKLSEIMSIDTWALKTIPPEWMKIGYELEKSRGQTQINLLDGCSENIESYFIHWTRLLFGRRSYWINWCMENFFSLRDIFVLILKILKLYILVGGKIVKKKMRTRTIVCYS